ncbi:MAG: ERCC4 domain-containing protein, partial [Dehalococcoidales bacterium]|nr:ERCC4 domain-containing protein [Dehalococcoidales bacterium]
MQAKFLLSPTENSLAEELEDEAITSSIPEQKGADILLYTDSGIVGFQRKKAPHDFVLSVTDGRFARLLPLLTKNCTFSRLIIEEKFSFYRDGTLDLGRFKGGSRIYTRFTDRSIHGILNDIEFIWGVHVHTTRDIKDTVTYLKSVRDFMSSKRHMGLFTRPKAKGTWVVPTGEDIELWILQSFPGIGPNSASAIIEKFNGRIPLCWTCTIDELASIKGIGKKKAVEL